jgi:hypothetical protein
MFSTLTKDTLEQLMVSANRRHSSLLEHHYPNNNSHFFIKLKYIELELRRKDSKQKKSVKKNYLNIYIQYLNDKILKFRRKFEHFQQSRPPRIHKCRSKVKLQVSHILKLGKLHPICISQLHELHKTQY